MPSKGMDPFCCCTGCQQKPAVYGQVPLLQQVKYQLACCSCVPYFACVTIADTHGNHASAAYRLFCASNQVIAQDPQQLYILPEGGGISVGGHVIDVTFYFIVTNGACSFALRSNALSVDENTPGASRVIDAAARELGFCSTLALDGGYTQFNLTSAGYTITIAAEHDVPINGRPSCVDDTGFVIPDNDPIKNLCCNCDCICKCMCMTVTSPGNGSASIGCLYGNRWTFANGVQVEIRPLDGLDSEYAIACYDLDERSGTRIDSYGSNSLADTSFAGVLSSPGKIGRCANFDGTELLHATNPALSFSGIGVTIGAWVNFPDLTGTKGNMTILSKTQGNGVSGFSWKLWYNNSAHRLEFSVANGTVITSVTANSFGAISQNTWYFVAGVIDTVTGTIRISVNANAGDSTPFSGTVPITYGDMCLGGQDDGSNHEYMYGLIDQTAIYKNKLGFDWITALYNFGAGRTCEADDRCYLHLTNTGPYVVTTLPSPILLDNVVNPCPRPTSRWFLNEAPTTAFPYNHFIAFEMRCAACEELCQLPISNCCPSGRTLFPTLIHANVSTTCPTCSSITVPMAWDSSQGEYVGTADMCGHIMTLKIGCPFTTLLFDSLPCTSRATTNNYATCDPILGTFTFVTNGIGCCGGSSTVSPTFTVTVYE